MRPQKSFSVKQTQFAVLKIFDSLGREVMSLFEGRVDPGIHTFHWQPGDLASGVYFARLRSGTFSMTRQILYLKMAAAPHQSLKHRRRSWGR
ncbi:MAG: T9SS type A sorting domain-containing protein [Ignavibacteriales bacterium]|nr:T9SS type A sorting domain-containing protein [Ignavibacteriales bacterium]